jgi:hypothetical protein
MFSSINIIPFSLRVDILVFFLSLVDFQVTCIVCKFGFYIAVTSFCQRKSNYLIVFCNLNRKHVFDDGSEHSFQKVSGEVFVY